MLYREQSIVNYPTYDCPLTDWEIKIIEYCFENPEESICGAYFNAIRNRCVRARVRRDYNS